VNSQINTLLNDAPDALNSLKELAVALNSDASFGYTTYAKIASSDASINNIRTDFALTSYVDGSLNDNYYTRTAIDSSMNTNFYNRTAVDASFSNIDTNYYNKTYIDASFSNIVTESLTTTGSGTITAGGGFIGTSFQPSANNIAIAFANITTTGNIDIGGQQSTGNLNLGIGARSATGNINIGTGSTSKNIINIGRGNVISIDLSSSTFSINYPITIGYNGNLITNSSMIGYQVSATNNTNPPVNYWASFPNRIANMSTLSLIPGVWNLSGFCIISISGGGSGYLNHGLSTIATAFDSSGTLPTQSGFASSINTNNYFQVNTVYLATADTSINFLLQFITTQSVITFRKAGICATRIA
jgi:hypothetical protein